MYVQRGVLELPAKPHAIQYVQPLDKLVITPLNQ